MSSNRTDERARADTEEDSGAPDYESWLKKASHLPRADVPYLPVKGQVIGEKYRIEAELGRGGMGAVFRATHTVSGKPVALKWLLRPTSDERAVQRFTREARAAGRIDHPNVVDVYDLGQEGEASYLVMELLYGESLRSRLRGGPLAPSETIELLGPAMQGVAAAHREGVIHRDLKPDNIFLCRARNGEARPAKVLDFGISTITSLETNYSVLTTEGTLLGTPSYIAPEQLESPAAPDVRTDVYAFGVIFYEALTGRVPFTADNYLGLALAIAKLEPVRPRTLRPEIPEALERIVLQAMSKNPRDRPQTMDDFIAALARAASAARVAPSSKEHVSGERLRMSLPAQRRKVTWLVVAALITAAVAVPWYLSVRQSAAMAKAVASTDPVRESRQAASPPASAEQAALPPAPEVASTGAQPRARPAESPSAADVALPGAQLSPPPSAKPAITPAASLGSQAARSAADGRVAAPGSAHASRAPTRKHVQASSNLPQNPTSADTAKSANGAPATHRHGRVGAIRADEL